MARCSVIKRRNGTLSYCPIVRDQKPGETDAEFFHACTRRVLMEELYNATLGAATDQASQAAVLAFVNAADKDGTLRARCEVLGVEIGGIADEAVLPEGDNDVFRPAWTLANKRTVNGVETCDIGRDMPKCREIARERIEQQRRMKIRDVLEREALGENVATEKASLRAINARAIVDAAQTPEELKTMLPEILK